MMSARKSQNPPRLSQTNAMTTIIINYLRLYMSRQDVALWTPINRNGLPDVEFPTPSSLKARNDHVVNINFFLPYKGEGDHPVLWGFGDGTRAFFWIKQGKPDPVSIHWGSWPKTTRRSMNSTGRQYRLVQGTIFRRGHGLNTIRDTAPPMYLIRTGIRSRSSIKANYAENSLRKPPPSGM